MIVSDDHFTPDPRPDQAASRADAPLQSLQERAAACGTDGRDGRDGTDGSQAKASSADHAPSLQQGPHDADNGGQARLSADAGTERGAGQPARRRRRRRRRNRGGSAVSRFDPGPARRDAPDGFSDGKAERAPSQASGHHGRPAGGTGVGAGEPPPLHDRQKTAQNAGAQSQRIERDHPRPDADHPAHHRSSRHPGDRHPGRVREDKAGRPSFRRRKTAGSGPSLHKGGAHGSRQDEAGGGARLEIYGALDLGTNNCRLLLARPSRRGFQVVDAFSRIIRLGEGVARTGKLSDAAMARTIDALRVCSHKIERFDVRRHRLVATEACRIARNGPEFLDRVRDATGLQLEILTRRMEASLAVSGCATLIDPTVDYVLVFDIGGGSSELIWLDLTRSQAHKGHRKVIDRLEAQSCMAAWTSLPVGVVTLAEEFGGRYVTPSVFEEMVQHVSEMLEPFEHAHQFGRRLEGASAHFLGTSGTVTTVAGIHLGLPRYDRSRVDGTWMRLEDAHDVTYDLLHKTFEQRVAEPCIGRDRADLVLAGCAILEALIRMWPCERLRVADRGLREGILATLMSEDGVLRNRRRRGGN